MPSILIRDLDLKTIKRLKARAAGNHRSAQAEAKEIIERGIQGKTLAELRREAEEFAKQFAGRKTTDSVILQREGRR